MSRSSLWNVAVAAMLAAIVLFIAYIAVRALTPAVWEFSIEAHTQVAELLLRPDSETQWQIDGATICVAENLEIPDAVRSLVVPNRCSRRMQPAWSVTAPEQVVRLNGGSSVLLQNLPDGGYAMVLRAPPDDSLGTFSVIGVVDDAPLGNRLDLFWDSGSASSRNFPFSGSTTLGRAVAWSDSRVLEAGTVAVYTGDVSADKRTLVDEAALMLGDQVTLGAPAAEDPWPKGFIRMEQDGGPLTAVVFGRADVLRIERFGDSGYDFSPGFLSKLASDPRIAYWGSMLAAYMTLVLSVQPFVGSGSNPPGHSARRHRFRWRKKGRQK